MQQGTGGSRLACLRQRAVLNSSIRAFFQQRNVLEVETPLLGTSSATDLHLEPVQVEQVLTNDEVPHYLQTSPEFAMKKLLALGSGSIYQLGKAFRFDEISSRHRPEFTLLEWYRTGFSEHQLMDEVQDLIYATTGIADLERYSYRQLFRQFLDLDPHTCSQTQLQRVASSRVELSAGDFDRDDLLYLLMSHCIEPAMPPNCFVFDYPASQASLAAVEDDQTGVTVARRFELYLNGMEIANGYRELLDPAELRRRFETDLTARRDRNRVLLPVDEKLIAAHESGIPPCAGVALGVDRLLMVIMGVESIGDVLVE